MAYTITHNKVSAIADDPAAQARGEILPSDWNDEHQIDGATEWGEIGGTLANQTDLQSALNAKQPTGNYITALTGDGTAAGPGSATLTLATVNANVGSFGAAGQTLSVTVNAKGLVTAISQTSIAITASQVTDFSTAADARITAQKGAAFGLAPLASDSKIDISYLPSAVLGATIYQGTWNASTNSPSLASGVGTKGHYYVVATPGSTNLDGITDWLLGDWAIFNGTVWQKVDNTDAVLSVNGMTGAVSVTTITGNAGTATALQNARTIGGVSFNGTANIVPQTITVAAETLDSTCFAGFFTTTTGDLQPKTINAIRADATTGDFYVQGSAATRTARLAGDGRGYMRYDDNSSSTALYIENRNISAGANRGVSIVWNLADDTTTTAIAAGSIGVLKEQVWTTTTSTQDAYIQFGAALNGTVQPRMRLYGSAALTPNANDGTSLGTSSLGWSDGYFATGAIMDFGAGNSVITHSSGVLTVSTGDLRVTTAGTNAASVVTNNGTQTLNNKRINPRVVSTASSATPTPDIATTDQYNLTALAAGATFGIPTGTPLDGQSLTIRIKDNGTSRTLAYNAIYRAVGITLPVATVISKTLVLQMVYNFTDTKWDVLQVNQEV